MAKTLAPPLRRRTVPSTTVFMKRMMAISGLVFLLFVLFRAYGSLHCFEGEVAYDHYAVFLQALLVPIMSHDGVPRILRLALIACLLVRAGNAFHLWTCNRRARGNDKYAVKKSGAEYFISRYAMRTMCWGGVILLLLTIWHILQYTTLPLTPEGYYMHERAYLNMYYSFQLWWVWFVYTVTPVALCLHMWHGVWSALQTLGVVRGNTIPFIRLIAFVLALALFAAFMAAPTVIPFGYVDAPMATGDYYPQFCDAIGSSVEYSVECVAAIH